MSYTVPMPRTISEARTLANIAARALRLREEGYTITEDDLFDGFFTVQKPDGTKYRVIYDEVKQSCTCGCFHERGTCKHLLAVKAKVEEDEWADAQAELHEFTRAYMF